jgi:NADPH:quinone reductase
MRAVGYAKSGSPEVIEVREVADPVPGEDDLLVRVRAAGISRDDRTHYADVMSEIPKEALEKILPKGYVAPPKPEFSRLGREFAGEVVGMGARVSGFGVGDRVMGHVGGSSGGAVGAPYGAQAELITIHSRLVSRIPDSLSWIEAGAIPYGFTVATDAMVQSELVCGERVLVHAVSSGIGSAAVQVARVMGASLVIGTVGSEAKSQKAKALGVDIGVDYHHQDFAEEVLSATGGKGVDVVFDMIGGIGLNQNVRSLATTGRMVSIQSSLGGWDQTANINVAELGKSRITIRGSVIGSRSLEERATNVRTFDKMILPHLASGRVRAVVDKVFSFDQARAAYEYMETGAYFGKIVLVPDPD